MSTDIKRPFTAVLGVREDVLPQEVVLSIQRILESKSASESDPLDMFSSEFDPVEILNSYFPDGPFPLDLLLSDSDGTANNGVS